MEIKLNTSVDAVDRVSASQPKRGAARTEGAGAAFAHSEALDKALWSVPDSRVDVVAKAKQATALSTYPPPETIKKISVLLAKSKSFGPSAVRPE